MCIDGMQFALIIGTSGIVPKCSDDIAIVTDMAHPFVVSFCCELSHIYVVQSFFVILCYVQGTRR